MNHYKWLEQNLQSFFTAIGIDCSNGIIISHGDKCYSYEHKWNDAGIPFEHGVAIFLLSYLSPYNKEVRETSNGWVKPDDWVIAKYPEMRRFLP